MSIENIIALIAALGVGGVLGAFLNSYFEQRKQTREHDIKIFKGSNEILSEQKLLEIFSSGLDSDHSIERDDLWRLEEWCLFFSEVGNQFLDKKLNKLSQKLLNSVTLLVVFISKNFSHLQRQDSENNNLYLYPDLSTDRGGSAETMSEYEKYATELEGLNDRVLTQYGRYRLTIKQLLKI